MYIWLVVSTHLKNISQIGSFPQVGVKINKYLKPPPRYVLAFIVCFKHIVPWPITFIQQVDGSFTTRK